MDGPEEVGVEGGDLKARTGKESKGPQLSSIGPGAKRGREAGSPLEYRQNRAWRERCHPWETRGTVRESNSPMVDITAWLCWISGSGDGCVPISLPNCQKSNLVSGAWAGLGLNGGRWAQP